MNLAFDRPWLLALLLLCLLPLLLDHRRPLAYPAPGLLPVDPWSQWLGLLIRLSLIGVIAALLLGLAGLHRPSFDSQRLGQGAEIVLLLDRSSSMDQPFARAGALLQPALAAPRGESKEQVARRLLAEFIELRKDDLYAMLLFSTNPIPVVPLTNRDDLVQAAIAAGRIGRGLTRTELGPGMIVGLELFEDRPYTGSRVVLLVSDGGARLNETTRQRIVELTRRNRVALYWIYIRSRNSPGLDTGLSADLAREIAPEQLLHEFFQTLETPYRAYSAEDPEALASAIAAVSQLQQLPILHEDHVPRRELATWCYGLGLILLLPVIAGRWLELPAWR